MSQSGEMRSGLTVPPSSLGDARLSDANVRIEKPTAATIIPRPILRGAEGSLPFFASAPKIARDTGVNATTKNGLNCWKSEGRMFTTAGIPEKIAYATPHKPRVATPQMAFPLVFSDWNTPNSV